MSRLLDLMSHRRDIFADEEDLDDDWAPPREARIRFLGTESVADGWRQFIDRDGTPSCLADGENPEDVLPPPHQCERPGCIVCESKPMQRVYLTVLVESQPRRMVAQQVLAPRHKLRSWMSPTYHQRIQKKWDKRVLGEMEMVPAMEKRILSVSRYAADQLRRMHERKKGGVVMVNPMISSVYRSSGVEVSSTKNGLVAHTKKGDMKFMGWGIHQTVGGYRHVVKGKS